METKESIISNYNHSITLTERKNLLITGVKKIENFDKEEFLIETTMGFLVVKGDGLELIKLDTISGNVSIKGIVNGFTYIDDNSKIANFLHYSLQTVYNYRLRMRNKAIIPGKDLAVQAQKL